VRRPSLAVPEMCARLGTGIASTNRHLDRPVRTTIGSDRRPNGSRSHPQRAAILAARRAVTSSLGPLQ
jgi:hypothetical protein